MNPPLCLLWTLDAHRDEQVVVRPQIGGKRVNLMNKGSVDGTYVRRLDDDVDLMRFAPHTQHVKFRATCNASEETIAEPRHGVLFFRRHV